MLGISSDIQQRRRLTPVEANFTCAYCHMMFDKEHRYVVHKCKAMLRAEELKTPTGQAAWNYYTMWFRAMRRVPPSASTFVSSRTFVAFFNFVKFTKRVNLPKPERFITFMVQKNFQPQMWTADAVYVMYIEHIDRTLTPMEHARMSIDTLFKVADAGEVDVADVFDVLRGNDIIQLIRTRRLSPWLLLNSKKFKLLFATGTSEEERSILGELIRVDYWSTLLKTNAAVVTKIKLLTDELGI